MKKLKYLFLLILVSCSAPKVMTDYNTETNFNEFTSFAFYDDAGKGLNELDVKRVMPIIAEKMQVMNFIETENPDFLVNFTRRSKSVDANNSIGIGIGGGGGNGGFGISGGIPIQQNKINEDFTIEFVNATTNLLIWQGTLTSKVSPNIKPEEKKLHLQNVIHQILSAYPPQ